MDHLNDKSLQTLHVMSKQFLNGELPAFVKNADIANERPDARAPLTVYGDPSNRSFPCHTKVATWLSCLYFWGQPTEKIASSCPKEAIADRLTKAANYWGILPDVQRLQDAIRTKSASPQRQLTDDDYALAVDYGKERIRRFPLVNTYSIKQAAANLYRFRTHYPYAWRKKASIKILEKAMQDKVNLELPHLDYLLKAASVYPADNTQVAQRLVARSYLFPTEIRDRMRKAAEVLKQSDKLKLTDLCELLDAADRHYKKFAEYNRGLALPEEVCFKGVEAKVAMAPTTVELTTGAVFALDEIKKAGIEPFTVLNDDYLKAVAANDQGDLDMLKIADVLPTIPKDDAQVLERALTAVGVKPMEKLAMVKNAFDISKLSVKGFSEVLGAPKDSDFVARFNLRHGQGCHDELEKKQVLSKR